MDSAEEAISRAMVGQFCVCEIASSFAGPTRYGFIAPVSDPESDDEEFIHFATQDEAINEAKRRIALDEASPVGGVPAVDVAPVGPRDVDLPDVERVERVEEGAHAVRILMSERLSADEPVDGEVRLMGDVLEPRDRHR